MADGTSASEKEVTKYFAFNETGNVMVSSTVEKEKDLREEVIVEFQKVAVLFDAVSTAIMRSGKDLNDYETLNKLLGTSQWCEQVHTECRTLEIKQNTVAVNVGLIMDILGDISATGAAMRIAKSILTSIGSKLGKIGGKDGMFTVKKNSNKSKKRVAHILFVCEDLMGMPLISIQCIHASENQDLFGTTVGKCGQVSKTDLTVYYQVDTYMFVDPAYIEKFTPEFKKDPEFEELISSFTKQITSEPAETEDGQPATGGA